MRWILTLACVAFAAPAWAQVPPPASADPDVSIATPEADAYLSGLTPLRAAVDPPEVATSVTFFVDGRQVCE